MTPHEVRFRGRRPPHFREHERVFGCRVLYEQPAHGIVFPRGPASLPLCTAQADVCSYLERLAHAALAKLPAREDDRLTDVARAVQETLIAGGDVSLARIARRLGLGARTLQRRLADRGVSYQTLVDDVRKAEALSLLTRTDLTVDVVAERLGYADSKAFRRAFRRWTGVAPAQARRDGLVTSA